MKTYSTRTNAKRAAIKAGIPADQVEITVHKVAGEPPRFGFKQKGEAQAPSKAAPAAKGKAKSAAAAKVAARPVRAQREERNGIKRPAAGGLCAAVWQWLDSHPDAQLKDVRAAAEKKGWNVNNASIELYQWRKFNAPGRTKKAA